MEVINTLPKPYTNKQYADFASFCNNNNCIIVDKGSYLEAQKQDDHQPTIQEILEEKERSYNMPRVIREGILGNPSAYSSFNVNKANELEQLAEEVRKLKEGK